MVAPIIGWAFPASGVALTAAVVAVADMPDRVSRGLLVGVGLAALLAYVSTAALLFSWRQRWFWPVWVASILIRLIFVATTTYVVFRHTQLDFVTTMASLVGFTTVFSVVESATCLKKG